MSIVPPAAGFVTSANVSRQSRLGSEKLAVVTK
jgi:hypothetical protein